jgi:hypothetical protein
MWTAIATKMNCTWQEAEKQHWLARDQILAQAQSISRLKRMEPANREFVMQNASAEPSARLRRLDQETRERMVEYLRLAGEGEARRVGEGVDVEVDFGAPPGP